jgi:hypothetical protein
MESLYAGLTAWFPTCFPVQFVEKELLLNMIDVLSIKAFVSASQIFVDASFNSFFMSIFHPQRPIFFCVPSLALVSSLS